MEFTVKITCDNSAFDGKIETEVSRILGDLARAIETGLKSIDGGRLFDSNGNTVGSYTLKD